MNVPSRNPTRDWNRRAACLAGLGLGLAVCALVARAHSASAHFNPVNGTFQSFNPLRRLLLGQHVGRDFDTYLGIGPIYLSRLAAIFFGEDYRSSLFIGCILSSVAFLATVAFLGRLSRLSWSAALSLAAIATTFAAWREMAWLPASWESLRTSFAGTLFLLGTSTLDVRVGTQLRLASSGERTIAALDGPNVWLDGAPLVPAGDSYPHWIEIVRE